ncbi:MAG: heme-binding protein [bacterium]|nr:heme-binding protein [bacterium]
MLRTKLAATGILAATLGIGIFTHVTDGATVNHLPTHSELKAALIAARNMNNGGLDTDMWATIVTRDGFVHHVAFTGADRDDQWPGSRVISAQKANAANAFSLEGLALSTANLFSPTQPGASLFGLLESNPVDTDVAYRGNPSRNGRNNDPMRGRRIGGVNAFGGGLALYNAQGVLVGGLGVSGDTSPADHNIAWHVRSLLELDYVPAGVSGDADRPDNIIFDIAPDVNGHPTSAGGFGHPHALVGNEANETAIANALPPVRTVL